MTYYENHKYMQKDTATKYDNTLPKYFMFDFESKAYKEESYFLEKYLSNKGFNNTLEFGVGTGRMTQHILPITTNYTGIDLSISMIESSKKRFGSDFPEALFVVSPINDFIDNADSLDEFDFVCSFYAYNYGLLSFWEYYNPETDEHGQYEDTVKAEKNAVSQINKLFSQLKKGTKFYFYYFDAYSVEQSYVTRILEQELPFPHNDRGYTLKVLVNYLKNMNNISFEVEYLNGYAQFENLDHLVNFYSTLHLARSLEKMEDIRDLVNYVKVFQQQDGRIKLPSGVNVISGEIL